MVKVRPCWPLARGWRQVTNLGGNQLILACVYARRRCVAAVALPPSYCCRLCPCRHHPRCRRRHRHRHCRHGLTNAMVKKYACVGRWREDWRQQNKRRRLWLRLRLQYAQIAGTTMWVDAAQPMIERLGSDGLLPGVPFFDLREGERPSY